MKRVGLLLVILVGLGAISGCVSNPTEYEGGAELAQRYLSLDQLFDDAQLVVLGTFTGNIQVQNLEPGDPSAGNIQLREFTPETWIKGTVSAPVWVALHAREDPITGKWIGTAGEALYRLNARYVLFLNKSLRGDYYWTTGAWQGSFGVKNGKVWSRAELGESDPSAIEMKGQGLSELLDALRNIQTTP